MKMGSVWDNSLTLFSNTQACYSLDGEFKLNIFDGRLDGHTGRISALLSKNVFRGYTTVLQNSLCFWNRYGNALMNDGFFEHWHSRLIQREKQLSLYLEANGFVILATVRLYHAQLSGMLPI
jgi:hypothetical protein